MISDSVRARMKELCDIMQEVSGVNPLIKSQKRVAVAARMMVSCRLVDEGVPALHIEQALGWNHATISHYKDRMDMIWYPGWEAERELWLKFKAKLEEKAKQLQPPKVMSKKIILKFGSISAAKRYVEKVKKLPYVSYATDYSRGGSNYNVMVCGEFTEENEKELVSLKQYR